LRNVRALFPLLLAFTCPMLFGDQVSFKNGDRLTGSIVKSDSEGVVVKTEIAGVLTVQWPQIQELRSDQRLYVGLADGKTLVGKVISREGRVEIHTETNATVVAPAESVVVLRNDTEQLAYEKSQHPSLLQGWEGSLDVGFTLTRGNSDTKNIEVGFRGVRQTDHDKLTLYAQTIYSTDDLSTAQPHTTANENKGGARFDRNLTSRFFVFANTDFMTDALQDLNLRSVFGGGVGYHLIKRERTTLDLFGGANFTRENYVELKRNLAAGQYGEEFTKKVGESTELTQNLTFFPDLSEKGSSGINYRTDFSFGMVTRINRWLGWKNNMTDTYVTNPPIGKKQNEFAFTSGLNLAFLH
jgi:putative salt-induced outer membrane protein